MSKTELASDMTNLVVQKISEFLKAGEFLL